MRRWGRTSALVALISAIACGARAEDEAYALSDTHDTPAGYVDRLIDGGALPALNSSGGDDRYDGAGPPRYLQVLTVLSGSSGAGASSREDGLAVSAGIETLNYGTLTLQGAMRAEPFGGSLALIQRGMPVDGAWSVNNALGTINSPQIDLARSQYRFYLPTFPLVGGSTEWLGHGALQLQAAVGEPGQFDGLQLDGFERFGGVLLAAGGQWRIDRDWTAGLQIVDARAVTTPALTEGLIGLGTAPNVQAGESQTNAAAVFGALAWRGGDDRDQLDFVASNGSPGPSALGVWFDGEVSGARLTQNYGAFWLQRDLAWGYLPISSDVEGAYYRAAYQSQRWLFNGGLDAARSISGAGLSGLMFTSGLRFQADPATGYGASLSYRHSYPDGGQGDVYVESRNRLGVWRLQLDQSFDNNDALTRLSYDQTWTMPVGARLMTTLFVTREDIVGRRSAGGGAAVSGGGDLLGRLSWDGAVSYDSTIGAGSSGSLNANIGLTAKLNDRWSLSATYFDNRNQSIDLNAINPIVPVPLTPVVTRSSAFLLTLRFAASAGSPSAPLGGAGAGSGAVTGHVFLDANGDGMRHAGEPGAPDVTVLLDGRYSARTDSQGRFEFPLVATGPHEIRVVADNLPLPWTVAEDGRRTVIVHARGILDMDIAATRIR